MTFNPANYAKTSLEASASYDKRQAWREENKHLAIPFFVKGLRDQIPDVYPDEMVMIAAPSGEGKTKILKTWFGQIQESIGTRRAVAAYGSQEETTERLIAEDREKNGEQRASSRPSVFIGNSFGMNAEQLDDMHMTNFVQTLTYIHKNKFAEEMPLASIIYDYIQATPNDPHRRKNVSTEHRFQIDDNVRRLFQCTQTFKCPVFTATQTNLKTQTTPYHKELPIPGRADLSESQSIFTIPDFVFSFLLVRKFKPVGSWIEFDNWKFRVDENLIFLRFLKARGHTPETAKGIDAVFPLRIINDEYVYDQDYHDFLLVNPPVRRK